MAEEAKTYVFGNDGASSMWPLAAMSNGGFNGGWGGGILGFLAGILFGGLWGGNGFGGWEVMELQVCMQTIAPLVI